MASFEARKREIRLQACCKLTNVRLVAILWQWILGVCSQQKTKLRTRLHLPDDSAFVALKREYVQFRNDKATQDVVALKRGFLVRMQTKCKSDWYVQTFPEEFTEIAIQSVSAQNFHRQKGPVFRVTGYIRFKKTHVLRRRSMDCWKQ
jgi:hypothetical protein